MVSQSWLILGCTLDNQQVSDHREIGKRNSLIMPTCMMEQQHKRITRKDYNRWNVLWVTIRAKSRCRQWCHNEHHSRNFQQTKMMGFWEPLQLAHRYQERVKESWSTKDKVPNRQTQRPGSSNDHFRVQETKCRLLFQVKPVLPSHLSIISKQVMQNLRSALKIKDSQESLSSKSYTTGIQAQGRILKTHQQLSLH